jgi:phosphatidylglycerol---prolipoprotein diacylglyceryl transferase
MHPVLLTIGNFPVRSYSILFTLAFLCGFGVTLYIAGAEGHSEIAAHLWNAAPWLLVAGLVGARIWQVAFFTPHFYLSHLSNIPAVWHGGLSIQGGIVGATLYAIFYVRRHKLAFWTLADLCTPGLLIGQSIGRDANLLNGDAFGDPTHQSFGLLYPQASMASQTYGTQPLWPAEVWEGQADVLLFAFVLIVMQRRRQRGVVFLFYVIMYNAVRFGLEYLRGDSPRYLFHWDAAQWTGAPVIIIGLILILWRLAQRPID